MHNRQTVAAKMKDISIIGLEWDRLVEKRHHQITSGEDISYIGILIPTIIYLLSDSNVRKILDIGSGCGYLASILAKSDYRVVAIDISHSSIEFSEKKYGKFTDLNFVNASIEEYSNKGKVSLFDAAVANMTLITSLDIKGFIAAVKKVLKPGGLFIITITHPAFWPQYWGYNSEIWYDYNSEIFIEAPFRISNDETEFITTHIHRPIHKYVETFIAHDFIIDKVVEPYPSDEVARLYKNKWLYPRFLGFRLIAK